MAKFFWHNLEIEEVERILRTNIEKGLSEKEVKLSLKEFGKNELPKEKPLSRLRIFLEQFKSPLIYILLIAGIITLVLKEFTDAIVIFGAVFLNTVVGYIQENKASKTLKELKKLVKYTAEVLREGNLKIIDSSELVPGDIIILNPGDKVPADGRIIESHNLKTNEMTLTGEWLSAEKKADVLTKETPLADRDNMVYMGTIVEDGKGKAVVVETGVQTEIGKIATMIKETPEEKTPYQKKIARFSGAIGIIIGIVCFGIFIEGIITGGEFIEMFIIAVAVAVAAIPEGLPVAMTVILALGMQRILKKGGLVRKLSSAETLGSTSIICTDKTATLTEGKMKVNRIITPGQILEKKPNEKAEFLTLKIAALTSEAFIENPESPREEWILRGRPTDKALLEAGIEAGFNQKKEFEKKKIAELPFNPINKFIATVFEENEKHFLYVCGAPERILERCNFYQLKDDILPLSPETLKMFQSELRKLARAGLRVVGTGYKKVQGSKLTTQKLEDQINNLLFAGFITLKDPIRKEVKEAIRICRQAGMRTIIATGDHKLTAESVAKEIGFKIAKENILEGKELDKLSDKDFEKILEKIKIYARVEPKHKTRIIEAWQKRGEVVAMTGDGINDAPALKKADIGVALGSGTEVAKETSDLILLNDSFSIIVKAVEEGRAILDNIRKVITYLLSDSFTEVILISVSILAGFPLPITAIQILWVNLIEDGLPDIALAFEPKEKDLMKMKPAAHKIHLLTQEMKVIIFIIGLITDLILLGLFFWLFHKDHNIVHIRTMIFACLSIDSLFYVFSCKSLRRNLWHINPFSNKLLIAALIIGVLVLVMAIYLPLFQTLLKTVPLNLQDWTIIISLGLIEITLIEATKWYFIVRHQTEL
ncbi:MAG: HAD-IC family P-type ATPase [Candidatus Nealsonbacteria bacterium]|nr:MAG: HAD-IC family P-type ATPase [Candidatus Nealsonbacteria bacterium]